MRRLKEEDGAETLEVVAIFPLVILVIVIIWQFALAGYTAIITAGTAREAVRAAAVSANCHTAAANASIGWDGSTRRVSCSCSGEFCRATVRLQIKKAPLPLIGDLPNYPWVTSTAYMRYEPPYY